MHPAKYLLSCIIILENIAAKHNYLPLMSCFDTGVEKFQQTIVLLPPEDTYKIRLQSAQ